MRFDSVIYLINLIESEDEPGHPVITPTRRETFAEKRSVNRREFYQALANEIRPEVIFAIWAGEYKNEPLLEHEGTTYQVIRSYSAVGQKEMELTCAVQDLIKTDLARLRDTVEIWHNVPNKNSMGEESPAPERLCTVPAQIEFKGGGNAVLDGVIETTNAAVVTIHFRSGISPDMFLKVGGQRYEIRYIEDPFNRHETLVLTVEKVIP